MSLLVGGRIFYEIDMTDGQGDSIRFMHFHSALDVIDEFEVALGGNKPIITIVVILILLALIISIILFYIYIRNRKKVGTAGSGTTEIEINQFKQINN